MNPLALKPVASRSRSSGGTELGEGGFSTVRLGTNRSTGARFAVKEAPHKPGHDPLDDPDDVRERRGRFRDARRGYSFQKQQAGTALKETRVQMCAVIQRI